MEPKIRRFKINDGAAIIDKNGEFLHINDIMLILIKERQRTQSKIAVIGDNNDEWTEKCKFAYKQQIEILNELEQYLIKSN